VSVPTREEVAGGIERAQETLYGLQAGIDGLRSWADEIPRGGLIALDLERALIRIAAAARHLDRALQEAQR
jgi:hypothetical protein